MERRKGGMPRACPSQGHLEGLLAAHPIFQGTGVEVQAGQVRGVRRARTDTPDANFSNEPIYWCSRANARLPGPARWASLGCRRRMISVAFASRSSSGFRLIWMRPLLRVVLMPSIPMKDDRLSTAEIGRASCRER